MCCRSRRSRSACGCCRSPSVHPLRLSASLSQGLRSPQQAALQRQPFQATHQKELPHQQMPQQRLAPPATPESRGQPVAGGRRLHLAVEAGEQAPHSRLEEQLMA